MMIAVVTALLAADPSPPTIADVEFSRVVERFAAASPLYRADLMLPEPVKALGAPGWRERDAASTALSLRLDRHDRQTVRWLVMAERSADAEVRGRASTLLYRYARCPETHEGEWTCSRCEGGGDLRYKRQWTPELGEHWVERDLFPGWRVPLPPTVLEAADVP